MSNDTPIYTIIPFEESRFTALKEVLASVCSPLPTAEPGNIVAIRITAIYDDKGQIIIEAPSQFIRKTADGYRLQSWKALKFGQPDYLRLALIFSRIAIEFPVVQTFEEAIRQISSGEDNLELVTLVLTMNGVGIMAVHPGGEYLVELSSSSVALQQQALEKCVQLIVPVASDNHTKLRLGLANRHLVDVLRIALPDVFSHIPETVRVP